MKYGKCQDLGGKTVVSPAVGVVVEESNFVVAPRRRSRDKGVIH